MGEGPRYRVQFRRRRTGRTDYSKRLKLLNGRTTRLVVRRSNRAITVQFVDYDATGDKVLATANSRDLGALGWTASLKSLPAAYLTGVLAGTRAKKAGVEEALLDVGHRHPNAGGRMTAVLKGVVDAGVEVPHDEEILPEEDRLQGEHLESLPEGQFDATLTKIKGGA